MDVKELKCSIDYTKPTHQIYLSSFSPGISVVLLVLGYVDVDSLGHLLGPLLKQGLARKS